MKQMILVFAILAALLAACNNSQRDAANDKELSVSKFSLSFLLRINVTYTPSTRETL